MSDTKTQGRTMLQITHKNKDYLNLLKLLTNIF